MYVKFIICRLIKPENMMHIKLNAKEVLHLQPETP